MERRQSDPHLTALCDRVVKVEENQVRFAAELSANTAMTTRIEANTSVIVNAWQALEGAFKVLRVLGKIGKYTGYILTAALAGWAIVKGLLTVGITPPPGGAP